MRCTIVPMSRTRSPSASNARRHASASSAATIRDKADAAVEGLGQVRRGEFSGFGQPDEDVGQSPATGVDFRAEPGGQNPADIPGQPAAGDMGETPDQPLAMRGERSGRVEPRGRKQRRPERSVRERRVVVPRKPGTGDDPPDQGETVRMNSRRGQREDPVAFPDALAGDQVAPFRRADREPREVVLPVRIVPPASPRSRRRSGCSRPRDSRALCPESPSRQPRAAAARSRSNRERTAARRPGPRCR